MFSAAHLVGRALRKVREIDGAAFHDAHLHFDVSFLLGGQIKGHPMGLFLIYPVGNFIECSQDAPYMQIGESKYGKPDLDRAISFNTDLHEALKIGLISMDATMRAHIGVGLPIDIGLMRRDTIRIEVNYRIDNTDPYFHELRDRWATALKAAHTGIPSPPYGKRHE